MKTLCKRIAATMSAVAMLSAIAIMPSYAENEESILIRCIDQCTGDNAYLQQHWATEGAIGMLYTEPDKTVTASFTADIEEEGWYDVKFVMASCSSVEYAAGNFSKLNFWIDDNEPQWLSDYQINTETPTARTTNPSFTPDCNFEETQLLDYVYFDEGVHTFNFESEGLNRFNEVRAGFYSIELNKVDEVDHLEYKLYEKRYGKNAYLQPHWATEGAIGMMYTDPSMKVTGNFDLMIYNPGWYDVKFVMASCSGVEYAVGNFSKLNFWIDDNEPQWLSDYQINTETPTARTTNNSFTADRNFEETQLLDYVYLDTGVHTFNFESDGVNRFNEVKAGFYSIELNRVEELDHLTYKLYEKRYGKNAYLQPHWATEGAIGMMYTDPSMKVTGNFDLMVYNPGWYDVKFVMASNSSAEYAAGNFSKLNFQIDDSEPMWLADSSISSNPTVRTTNNSFTADRNFEETQLLNLVYLDTGMHSFDFESDGVNRFNEVKAGFYSVELNRVDTSELNDITLHGGDYPNLTVVDDNGNEGIVTVGNFDIGTNLKDGGKVLCIYRPESNAETTDGYKVKVPFTVYEDGLYDVTVGMRAGGYLPVGTSGWTSDVYVGIDAETPKLVKAYSNDEDAEINAEIAGAYDDTIINILEPRLWRAYDLKPMELAKGNHTMVFHIPHVAPNNGSNIYIFGLDTIHIRPAKGKDAVTIEGESMEIKDKSAIIESDVYTGGKALNITNTSATAKKWFTVSKPGNYRVIVRSGGTGSYKIDDKNVSGLTVVRDLSSTYGYGWKEYRTEMYLDEGIHNLELVPGSAYALDVIRILPAIEVTSINASAKKLLSKGEKASINVVNQNGEAVTFDDVDTLCFESDNNNIVTVDSNGTITAVNQGEATITVGASVNGKTYQDTIDVVVTGVGGLYIKKAAVSGNDVSVTLESSEAVSATKVIVAVYEDGENSSLKETKIADFDAMSANSNQTKTINMTSVSSADKISVFVFDSLNTLAPMCGKKEVR